MKINPLWTVATALLLNACQPAPQNNTTTNQATSELLNVSYDVSRDFYKEYNQLFNAHHTDNPLNIKQSHGGSSKQALSVANGLQADVVTMNQGSDIDLLVKKGLVNPNWQQEFANNAVPFTSAVVFLVHKGNPKHIHDWQDLTKADIGIVMPNPKTSGNGRYAFLGAYGYGLHSFGDDKQASNNFVKAILTNVIVFENGGRAATTTFTQRGIGDVLITAENEANLIAHALNAGQFEVIYPSYTVATENPVAIVQAVSDKKGTTAAAKAYLGYLWSKPAQQLAADLYLRPKDSDILAQNSDKLPPLNTFMPTDVFGSWDNIMTTYFQDGGVFDGLVAVKK